MKRTRAPEVLARTAQQLHAAERATRLVGTPVITCAPADAERLADYMTAMHVEIPKEARPVARVLLLGPGGRLLLLLAQDVPGGHHWWVTPGGGLDDGESFEQAARRELLEETGIQAEIGPWVWTRRHAYSFNGQWCDQYERFFVARTHEARVQPLRPDSYVRSYRWWTLQDLAVAADDFAPRRLPELWPSVARGEYPEHPIDCGV